MDTDESRPVVRRPRKVARAALPAGPARELREAVYRLYAEADYPRLDDLAAAIADDDDLAGAPKRDTIHKIIRSGSGSQLDTVSVAVALARLAGRTDAPALAGWVRELWLTAQTASHPCVLPSGTTGHQLAGVGQARPISQWNPLDLGVHRAIDLSTRRDGEQPPEVERLTAYVARDHDRRLKTRLEAARSGRSVFALLVGGSCTGKTRALYEAVADCLPGWSVRVPRDADDLCQWVDADSPDAVEPETVLWLDEAQRFLPAAVEALALLLDRGHPLAVVGSIWPDYWRRLILPTTDPEPGGARIERLLERHLPKIGVSGRFDQDGLRRLGDLARRDRRLAAALAAGGDQVTQHLTGGPELAAHYDDPDGDFFTPIEHAVITAALDARRLGHSSPIPTALLAEAAAAYLPARLRVSDDLRWIDTVLRSLCHDPGKRVRGALAALIPHRSASGIGPADGYHPADYLDHHVRHARRFQVPPTEFWEAASRHALTPRDLGELGCAAELRWRLRWAALLYRQAAVGGEAGAFKALTRLRVDIGDWAGAEQTALQAAEAGDNEPLEHLVDRHSASRDYETAERLAQVAGPTALRNLARRQEEAGGRALDAERLYRLAADAGDKQARERLAVLQEGNGDHEGAEESAHLAGPVALRALARIREKAGLHSEAVRLYQSAANAGDIDAIAVLAVLNGTSGEKFLDHPAGALVLALMALRLDRSGQRSEAERLADMAARLDQGHALATQSYMRCFEDDYAEAERLGALAAAAGDAAGLASVAVALSRAGEQGRGEELAMRAAAAGTSWALYYLAGDRQNAGDSAGAERLYRAAADAGDGASLGRDRSGDRDDAELLAVAAANAGYAFAYGGLALRREQAGEYAEAERLAFLADDAGYQFAVPELAWARDQAGRCVEAERFARSAADAGTNAKLSWMAASDPAWQHMQRYGLEPEGRVSDAWW